MVRTIKPVQTPKKGELELPKVLLTGCFYIQNVFYIQFSFHSSHLIF